MVFNAILVKTYVRELIRPGFLLLPFPVSRPHHGCCTYTRSYVDIMAHQTPLPSPFQRTLLLLIDLYYGGRETYARCLLPHYFGYPSSGPAGDTSCSKYAQRR